MEPLVELLYQGEVQPLGMSTRFLPMLFLIGFGPFFPFFAWARPPVGGETALGLRLLAAPKHQCITISLVTAW